MKPVKNFAVIGGGSLGTLIALRLSNLGLNVEIYESKSELLRGASYLGEGKIHLGYTYGLSQKSSYGQLVESALNFAEIVETSIGHTINWKDLTSIPFTYTIAQSSLIDSSQFMNHAINIIKLLQVEDGSRSYLGEAIDEVAHLTRTSESSFLTKERAVDLEKLGKILKEEVGERINISTHLNSEILSIETKLTNKYILTTRDGKIDKEFDYVINCTWDQRHNLDRFFWDTLPELNYRTKIYISAKTTLKEAAETTVLGKFGDLVVFNTGRLYASDYLTGLTSFTTGFNPNFAEREELPEELVFKHWNNFKSRFSAMMPELNGITEIETFERTVVAKGDKDIDQLESGLHDRPPYYIARKENFISALGTKFTTIPQLAMKIVDWIEPDGVN